MAPLGRQDAGDERHQDKTWMQLRLVSGTLPSEYTWREFPWLHNREHNLLSLTGICCDSQPVSRLFQTQSQYTWREFPWLHNREHNLLSLTCICCDPQPVSRLFQIQSQYTWRESPLTSQSRAWSAQSHRHKLWLSTRFTLIPNTISIYMTLALASQSTARSAQCQWRKLWLSTCFTLIPNIISIWRTRGYVVSP